MRAEHTPLTPIVEAIDDGCLSQHLRFDPDDGHIRLYDERMLLVHGFSLAELRRELIERLGLDRTREMMTRMGYQQGVRDATLLREREGGELRELLALGPRLREIEGFVRNHAIERMRFDADSGEFWGDYFWQSSWEADAHRRHFGTGATPACWMMTGYACGFTTAMMGRPILWRESECVATGHAQCRVVGRPLEDCDDAEADLRFLRIEEFVAPPKRRHSSPRGPVTAPPTTQSGLPDDLIGASTAFNATVQLIKRVAPTDATVLLSGESGVGKERFARLLHRLGPRRDAAFVSVNCAAIPAELVEAELFGVERGAYTGASAARAGRFERADGGTLLLDEIASLPLPAQGKLLRVLQEREIERVGDSRTRPVDVRIISASNRDLRDEVDAGRFREDLYFRLNVFPVEIPPLRVRRDDIPLLVNLFVEKYAGRFAKRIAGVTQRGHDALLAHSWPGNVRELQNVIERAVILADEAGSLDLHHLFPGRIPTSTTAPAHRWEGADDGATLLAELQQAGSLDGVERRLMDLAMQRSGGNLSAAARLLGMRRGQLEYRLRKAPATP